MTPDALRASLLRHIAEPTPEQIVERVAFLRLLDAPTPIQLTQIELATFLWTQLQTLTSPPDASGIVKMANALRRVLRDLGHPDVPTPEAAPKFASKMKRTAE